MSIWENEPLRNLSSDRQLMSFMHVVFWHHMDTLRDKRFLENLWKKNETPWVNW